MRNRLLLGVALGSVAVLAAGAPAMIDASQRLSGSQELLKQADTARGAVSLSRVIADERDLLVVSGARAAGDGAAGAAAPDTAAFERTDRRLEELLPDLPAEPRALLDDLPTLRAEVASGALSPLEVHRAYSDIVRGLDALTRSVSLVRPERSGAPAAGALPDLARAVDASSATRALLTAAALDEEGGAELLAAARVAGAREAAAVRDFLDAAGTEAAEGYERTVSGPEAAAAESFLAEFLLNPLDAPALLPADPADGSAESEGDEAAPLVGDPGAALAARTELQRGVLSSLSAARVAGLETVRDDDLTALQLRIVLLAAALLLVIGAGVHTARSLTRPLAAVRLGSRRVAADPAGEEPVRYTGRNDEFAEIVTAVNALHARTVELHRRAAETAGDHGEIAAERDRLVAERDRLDGRLRELTERLADLDGAVHGTFAHHAQRILALTGEQETALGRLEAAESDPDRRVDLLALARLAARLRRHGENLLLLAGAEYPGASGGAVPLPDVLRSAIGEIERHDLVEIEQPLPPVAVAGFAARDLGHLLAELLDNATAFSPADARVLLVARDGDDAPAGGMVVRVVDEGIGMTDERLAELNEWLSRPGEPTPPGTVDDPGIGMGLYTVARSASRHGLTARLSSRPGGGVVAEVVLPAALWEPLPEAVSVAPGTVAPTV
ncbi:sensor histidine kinase [Streptomyces alkaliphilus]|uniref:sensor histidine kinase n=2 Tax=Streptomyces alkaliphilus TaxID=1472722 RepID=UPI0034D15491